MPISVKNLNRVFSTAQLRYGIFFWLSVDILWYPGGVPLDERTAYIPSSFGPFLILFQHCKNFSVLDSKVLLIKIKVIM